MKNKLLLLVGTAFTAEAVCGAMPAVAPAGSAPARPAATTHTEAKAPITLVDTDLSPYGIPLILQAPANARITHAEPGDVPFVYLQTENYGLQVNAIADDSGRAAQEETAQHKDLAVGSNERLILVHDTPLAYRIFTKGQVLDDIFEVRVPDQGRNMVYTIVRMDKESENMHSTALFGKANVNAMFQAALAARVKPLPLPTALTEVSLQPFNVPLALKVPAGTSALTVRDKEEQVHLRLRGPYFALDVTEVGSDLAKGKAKYALRKMSDQQASGFTKVVVDEPLAYRLQNVKPRQEDRFAVVVDNPTMKKTYLITKIHTDTVATYTPAQVGQMYTAARSARPLPKPAPGTPGAKLTPIQDFNEVSIPKYTGK